MLAVMRAWGPLAVLALHPEDSVASLIPMKVACAAGRISIMVGNKASVLQTHGMEYGDGTFLR